MHINVVGMLDKFTKKGLINCPSAIKKKIKICYGLKNERINKEKMFSNFYMGKRIS
jgi:hypothetical protein